MCSLTNEDRDNIRKEIQDRLNRITRLAPEIEGKGVGIVDSFRNEIEANLSKLTLQDGDPPKLGGSGRLYITDVEGGQVYMNDLMLDAFNIVKERCNLDKAAVCRLIDNFLIHEIIHRLQNMGQGNHRGKIHYLSVLVHVDIEADASAALIQEILYFTENKGLENSDKWVEYREIILSIIHQTYMFVCMTDDGIREKENVEARNFSPEQLERYLIWHFQYHRIAYFIRESNEESINLNEFQILYRPAAGVRNQVTAHKLGILNINWPETENFITSGNIPDRYMLINHFSNPEVTQHITDVPQEKIKPYIDDIREIKNTDHIEAVCIGIFDKHGVRQFYLYNGNLNTYRNLFKGIFTCDITLNTGSGGFFNAWFQAEPRLRAQFEFDYPNDPLGPDPSSPPSPPGDSDDGSGAVGMGRIVRNPPSINIVGGPVHRSARPVFPPAVAEIERPMIGSGDKPDRTLRHNPIGLYARPALKKDIKGGGTS